MPKQGNTTGIPPRTGLDPSRAAVEDTKRRSVGSGLRMDPAFQDTTVAPYNRISTKEPCIGGCQ